MFIQSNECSFLEKAYAAQIMWTIRNKLYTRALFAAKYGETLIKNAAKTIKVEAIAFMTLVYFVFRKKDIISRLDFFVVIVVVFAAVPFCASLQSRRRARAWREQYL